MWVSTEGIQQELVFVPEEEGEHHHTQPVGSLCQLCRLRRVVQVVVGDQQCLVGTDGCCIAADVDQPVSDIALLQHARLIGAQFLHQGNSRPAIHTLLC